MSSMKRKTQLFVMLLIYNNFTSAENVLNSENVMHNHTHKERKDNTNLTKLQATVRDFKNEYIIEHKLNHTNESLPDVFNVLEDETTTRIIPNNTLENDKKSIIQIGINNINKSNTAAATSIPGLVELKANSKISARRSKILPFSSDVVSASNSFMENNEAIGNFIDLDLNQLSIENLQKLNTFTKISEYASFFGLDIFEENYEGININSANGTNFKDEKLASSFRADRTLVSYNSDNDIVSGVFASCQPELQTVVLDEPLGTMYLPGCVRLRRCGGCCLGNLLECRPTKTEPVKIKVLKVDHKSSKSIMSQTTSSQGRGRGRGRGRVSRSSRRTQSRNRAKLHIVNEWQHTACDCQCRVQAHHCHPNLQDYSPNDCACVCKNRSDEKLCYARSSSHFWEKSSCSCKCKRTLKCSTGEFFDVHSCRCSKELEGIIT